jgi:murein tripeptide amidase MpaA
MSPHATTSALPNTPSDPKIDPKIDWTRYHTYAELTRVLQALEAAYPHAMRVYSIGQSRQGRELWMVELTESSTGPAEEKPAYYVDGNCHGEEVLGCQVALYTLVQLLTRQQTDPWVGELLATRTFYIAPNINPDGAEQSMTTPYHHVGNGHYLPWEFEPTEGLYPADIDGDGYILQMRYPDAAGEWKISDQDARIMLHRAPGEQGGRYYRLLPEGWINGYDGAEIVIPKPPHGNLNRQFPTFWAPERGEYGAGDYPLNEPEALAVARFILEHRNIAGALAHHTHGGLILRPSSYRPDAELPPEDVWLFKTLGAVGEALTDYRLASIFEDFTRDKRFARNGGFGDWLYEQLGIPFLATELWDLDLAAGIRRANHFPFGAHSEAHQQALFAWCDEHLAGKGFIDWHAFDHPQLGRVELGGWDAMGVIRNAPGHLVESVAAPVAEFTLRMGACTPLIRVTEATAEALGAGLFKIRAVVKNLGYLPTHLTELGRTTGEIPEVEVTLVTEKASLIMNAAVRPIGHLDGTSSRRTAWSGWNPPWGTDSKVVEWLVRAEGDGAGVTVQAAAQKGGCHRVQLALDAPR